ncbi:MAG TPA: YdcF family protein [Bryobacteraceae bacterium]|jgi:uncharacterized SAM-binding protein YcdF (DUF218 family)
MVLAALLHTQILAALGGYLIQAVPPQKADVALVLAGDSFGNRILKGAELVREGFASKAVISGPEGLYGFHECDLAIPFAVKAGYPQDYFIPFPHSARSTREEATDSVGELHQLGAHRVLLVTSLYHTRRAGNLFRAIAPDITFVVVAAPDRYFTPNGWWHDREARKIFLNEWLKTVAGWFNI